MKVVLLEHPRERSSIHFNDVANAPLSSCLMSGYVASYLCDQGIETEIADAYTRGISPDQTVEMITQLECDVLGVNLVYSWENTGAILQLLDEIHRKKKVPIIAYGFFPTFAFKTLLEDYSCIDYIITGEPERTFFELVGMFKAGTDPEMINGVSYVAKGEVVVTGKRPLMEDLDSLPFPLRTQDQLAATGGNILGSRGCYSNCTFCCINNFYGAGCQWRGRSPENIFDEAHMLLTMLQERYLYFVDANFFGPGKNGQVRAETIAQLLSSEKGVTFGVECRVNDIQDASLRTLVDAGLRNVFLGVESASPSALKRMRKQTTNDQTVKALSQLREHDIEPHIGFIMFDPDSDLHDIRSNFDFLTSQELVSDLSCTVQLLYHPEIVLMGTDTYRALEHGKTIRLSSHSTYQAYCSFKDQQVHFLSECMASVCRYLLERAEDAHSPIYWQHNPATKNPSSRAVAIRLNDWLVGFFEELLVTVESKDVKITPQSKSDIIHNAKTTIDTFINTADSSISAFQPAGIRA
jgi:hypothetical protein